MKKEETLLVENIKCHGCANSIQKKLDGLEGLDNVSIDVEKGEISFVQGGHISKEAVASALAKMGYPEKGAGSVLQKAKSFVSCAKGRWSA